MFRTSMLAREESRIFEELLSRFDSLGDEQMLAVGVTPDWSTKGLTHACTRSQLRSGPFHAALKCRASYFPRPSTLRQLQKVRLNCA